jgi:hypothetical protein
LTQCLVGYRNAGFVGAFNDVVIGNNRVGVDEKTSSNLSDPLDESFSAFDPVKE